MSGGQRRRVSLAQALLGSPAVLILDEPTTGVDPEQRVVLRTVLAEIARTSIVVLSTQQTEDVAALCERVIVLDRGRVRYDGPVTDLVRQAADLLIVPPMNHIDLLDWTSFDAAVELGYRTTMDALDKARAAPTGARLFDA